MKKLIIISVACFVVAFLLIFLVESFYFNKGTNRYQGISRPTAPLQASTGNIASALPTTTAPSETSGKRTGTIVVDLSHHNNFQPWEIDTLLSEAAATGFNVKLLKDSQDFEESLRSADAYILISPQTEVTRNEINLIKQEVGKNMKLLLAEEPGRSSASNSAAILAPIPIGEVSAEFGFLFERDYLYNLKENDGNYRNIYLTDFKPNELTKGLQKIVFYSAGSLSGSDSGIVFTDDNTYSSKLETQAKLSPVFLTADSHVLGIYDVTFLTEPFNASFDNGKFLSNLSQWLTSSDRVFSLSDFPYFLKNKPAVAFLDSSLLPQALAAKSVLADGLGLGDIPSVGKYADSSQSNDMLIVGLFGDSGKVEDILRQGNIQLTGSDIEIGGIGTISQPGASIIYRGQQGDNSRLVILADTPERLQNTVQLLKDGSFRQLLVNDSLVIYQMQTSPSTEIAPPAPASPLPTPAPSPMTPAPPKTTPAWPPTTPAPPKTTPPSPTTTPTPPGQ